MAIIVSLKEIFNWKPIWENELQTVFYYVRNAFDGEMYMWEWFDIPKYNPTLVLTVHLANHRDTKDFHRKQDEGYRLACASNPLLRLRPIFWQTIKLFKVKRF